MNAENRPPFVTGLRRCGRTEAMLERIMRAVCQINFNNPDLTTWRVYARDKEQAKRDIVPRLLRKLDDADIKYEWHADSSERILLEIRPYGPNILIGAMPPTPDCRARPNVLYDHAASEWHVREVLWQLK